MVNFTFWVLLVSWVVGLVLFGLIEILRLSNSISAYKPQPLFAYLSLARFQPHAYCICNWTAHWDRPAYTGLFHKKGDQKYLNITVIIRSFHSVYVQCSIHTQRSTEQCIQIHAQPHASTWKCVEHTQEEMHSIHIYSNSCDCPWTTAPIAKYEI